MSVCLAPTLALRPIALSDQPLLSAALRRANLPHCEYTFATLWCWRGYSQLRWGVLDDGWIVLRVRGPDGVERYLSPIGIGDPRPAVEWCLRDLAEDGEDPALCLVPERVASALGPHYAVTPDPASADWVYRRADLADLPGRRFAAKRNHVHRFERANLDWTFEPLRPEDRLACRGLLAEWSVGSPEHPMLAFEQEALRAGLDAWTPLGLQGGVLRAGGRPVGFAVGERLTDDTFVVHHERADRAVEGAYQALCRAFARALPARFAFVDREQDLGVPGLRAAKASYLPSHQEPASTVTWAS
jgi:hypothetical protein